MIYKMAYGESLRRLAWVAGLALLCASQWAMAGGSPESSWKADPAIDVSVTANLIRQGPYSAHFRAVTTTAMVTFKSDARPCDFGGFAGYQYSDEPEFDRMGSLGTYMKCDNDRWAVTGWLLAIYPARREILQLIGTNLTYDLTADTDVGIQLVVPREDITQARLSATVSWTFAKNLSLDIQAGTSADGSFGYEAKLVLRPDTR